jgi:transporter family-2 protein
MSLASDIDITQISTGKSDLILDLPNNPITFRTQSTSYNDDISTENHAQIIPQSSLSSLILQDKLRNDANVTAAPSTVTYPYTIAGLYSKIRDFLTLPNPSLLFLFVLSLAAFSAGMLLVIQTAMTAKSGLVLGHSIRGTWVAFMGSTILMIPLCAHQIKPASKTFINSYRQSKIEHGTYFHNWYDIIGGILGSISVTLSVFLVPLVGYSVYYVCRICGQIFGSLVMDHFAILGYERRRFDLAKLLGVSCTLAGCLMIQDWSSSKNEASTIVYGVILGVVSGLIQPIQTGLNTIMKKARLNNDPAVSTLFYFFVGSAALTVAYAFTILSADLQYNNAANTWWCWLGGLLGVIYIFVGVTIPVRIGLSAFFMSVIAGQLTMSELTDSLGIFNPVRSYTTKPVAISGLIMAFIGCAIITIAKHRQTVIKQKSQQATADNLENNKAQFAAAHDDNILVISSKR